MSFIVNVHTTLRGEKWKESALMQVPEVEDIGTYKAYENMPPTKLMQRATFNGFYNEPVDEYDKLRQHLAKLVERHTFLEKAGVEEIIVFYTILSHYIHTPTEILEEEILMLSSIKAKLAITFDAPSYMRKS